MKSKINKKSLALFSILSFSLLSSFKYLESDTRYDCYSYNDDFEIYNWDFRPVGTDTESNKVSHYKYRNSFKFKLHNQTYKNYSLVLQTINEDFTYISGNIELEKEYNFYEIVRFDNNFKKTNYLKLVMMGENKVIELFNFPTSNIEINVSNKFSYLDIINEGRIVLETGLPIICNKKFTTLTYVFDFSHLKEDDFTFNYGAFDYSRFSFRVEQNKSSADSIYIKSVNINDFMSFDIYFNVTPYGYKERFSGYNQNINNSLQYFYNAKYVDGKYEIVQENLDYYKLIKGENPLYMINISKNNLDDYLNNKGYQLADRIYFGMFDDLYLLNANINVTLHFSVDWEGVFIEFPLKLTETMYYDALNYYLSSNFNYSLENYNEEFHF